LFNFYNSESLQKNHPNPFNPTTNFVFNLAQSQKIEAVVYDILGRVVASIAPQIYSAGRNEIIFNAAELSSGVYIHKLIISESVLTSKFTLLK